MRLFRVIRTPYPLSGWLEALAFNLAVGVLSIIYAFGARVGVHPIAFVLDSMLLAAIGMLTITGPGPDWRRIILMPQSWLIGTATILMEVCYYLLLMNVHPALGSTLIRAAVVATMIVGYLIHRRVPQRQQIVGNAVIVLAVIALFAALPANRMIPAGLAVLGCMVMLATRTFAAEFHPDNRAAKTVMAKLRVTGLVVLVTSIVGLTGLAVGSMLVAAGAIPSGMVVPRPAQLAHVPTLALAALAGVFALTAMAYFSYSSVVKITSENLVAMSGFTPITTLLLQELAGHLGLIPQFAIAQSLLVGMVVVAIGALITVTGAQATRLRTH